MRPHRTASRRLRAGISVIEMIVASALATLLMVLAASTWATFGRPAVEVESRARIELEGILAAQSLACDFGGFLADTPGRIGAMQVGTTSPYQVSSPQWDVSTPGVLLLNFCGSTTSEVVVVSYQLQGDVLMRTNASTGTSTAVARYATAFSAAADPGDANRLVITLTLAYHNFTTTFTLIGVASS